MVSAGSWMDFSWNWLTSCDISMADAWILMAVTRNWPASVDSPLAVAVNLMTWHVDSSC